MSKYIKLDDIEMLINACEWRMTLAKERHGEGFVEYSKQVLDVDELTKRLTDLPTIEVSEDCISREGLSDEVGRYYAERGDFGSFECSWISNAIKNAPSVVPSREEPKRGKWIVHPLIDEGRVELECPICGDTFISAVDYKPRYCENCGERMESDKE